MSYCEWKSQRNVSRAQTTGKHVTDTDRVSAHQNPKILTSSWSTPGWQCSAVLDWTLDKAAEICQSHTAVTMYVNHTVKDLMKCYEMCPNIQPDTFVFDQQSAGQYRVQSSIFSSFWGSWFSIKSLTDQLFYLVFASVMATLLSCLGVW